MKNNLEEYTKALLPTTRKNMLITEAKGFYVTVVQGNKVLKEVIDGTSQVGTNPLGHRNPELLKFMREYYSEEDKRPIITAGQDHFHPYQLELAKKFTEIFPGKLKFGDLKVYYCNSGSEAVERGSLKAAELYKGGNTFISFFNAFHGRTSLALSMNFSKGRHKEGFNFLARTLPAPYPAKSGFPFNIKEEDIAKTVIDYLEQLIIRESPKNINSIIIEPVQGEGGYVVPHKDFFPMLRELCDKYDIPMIADEVQSSLRTGKWFAIENFKTEPDMISIAKAFSGGISAFGAALIKSKYATKEEGSFGGTFGGSPKDCFTVLKTIEIIEKNNYLKNARKQGDFILKGLRELENREIVREVRGIGLMIGVEIQDKKGRPDPKKRDFILNKLLNEYKILTHGCGNDYINPSIRFLLPLNTTKEISEKIINSMINAVK